MKVTLSAARRVAATAVVTAGLAGATALAAAPASAVTSATTSAATPYTLTVCSEGSYASFVEFPGRGRLSTTVVEPGQCTDFGGWNDNGIEEINVFGMEGPAVFWIQSGHFRASKGGTVFTYGTSANPTALTPTV